MGFCILRLKGRPLLAIPIYGVFGIVWRSVALFPSYTLRRKLFRIVVFGGGALGWLAYRLHVWSGQRLPEPERSFVEGAIRVTAGASSALVIWSTVPGRGRRYVRLFDEQGKEVAFAKASLDASGRSRLRVEASALKRFERAKSFSVPSFILLREALATTMLITAVLPRGCQLRHPERTRLPNGILQELQERTALCKLHVIRQEDWFIHGLNNIGRSDPFGLLVDSFDGSVEVMVCTVHGDLGSENIFEAGDGRTILIDWEHFAEQGPCLTDPISFWIGQHHRAIRRNPAAKAGAFSNEFGSYSQVDICLALVYLAAFDVSDAVTLAKALPS